MATRTLAELEAELKPLERAYAQALRAGGANDPTLAPLARRVFTLRQAAMRLRRAEQVVAGRQAVARATADAVDAWLRGRA